MSGTDMKEGVIRLFDNQSQDVRTSQSDNDRGNGGQNKTKHKTSTHKKHNRIHHQAASSFRMIVANDVHYCFVS